MDLINEWSAWSRFCIWWLRPEAVIDHVILGDARLWYFILEISFLQGTMAAPPAHPSLGSSTAVTMVATQLVQCTGPLSSACPFPHISAQAQRAATPTLCKSAHEQATEPTRSTLRHVPPLRVRVRGPVLLRKRPIGDQSQSVPIGRLRPLHAPSIDATASATVR
jgi:hypothetical protein